MGLRGRDGGRGGGHRSDHERQDHTDPGNRPFSPTSPSRVPRDYFKGTRLCAVKCFFSPIPQKYERLGEKASVPRAGFRSLSPRPALVLSENHRDRQRGGRAPCGWTMGLGLPAASSLSRNGLHSRREPALMMALHLVIKATLRRRLCTQGQPGHW